MASARGLTLNEAGFLSEWHVFEVKIGFNWADVHL